VSRNHLSTSLVKQLLIAPITKAARGRLTSFWLAMRPESASLKPMREYWSVPANEPALSLYIAFQRPWRHASSEACKGH